MTPWWDSLLGEFFIASFFIGLLAFIAWRIELGRQPDRVNHQTLEGHNCIDNKFQHWNFWIAVAAAIIAIAAATLQWREMRTTLEVTERAYVEVGGGGADGHTIADFISGNRVELYVHNSGHTPAKYFWANSFNDKQLYLHLEKHFLHLQPNIDARSIHAPTINIPPGGTIEWPVTALTDKQLMDLETGCTNAATVNVFCDPFLLVWGTLEFNDSFGEYCCQPFCVSWDISQRVFKPCSTTSLDFCPTNYDNYCD